MPHRHTLLRVFVALAPLVPNPVSAVAWSQPTRPPASDTVVKLAGAPRYPRGGLLIAEATFGLADGPEEYLLGTVLDVLPARDGTTWILDGTPSVRGPFTLRQYATDGKYIRTIGRMGRGPGEFSRPTSLGQLPDGRVVLWQAARSTLTFYSEAGVPQKATTYPSLAGTGVNAQRTLHVDSRGNIAIEIYRPPLGRAVARVSPGGELIDIVASPDGLPDAVPPAVTAAGARARATLLVPHASHSIWSWSPLGYWVTGFSARQSFEVRAPRDPERAGASTGTGSAQGSGKPGLWRAGDPIVSVRWTAVPVDISAAERTDQAAYLLAQLRAMSVTPQSRIPEIPSRKPAYRRLTPAADGRVWVEVSVPSERFQPPQEEARPDTSAPVIGWREPSVYAVFEPSGTHVGRIQVPWGAELYVMKGNYAWAKTTDAAGVELVKRFRIQWR